MFHLNIIVFAEQLKESENSTEGLFEIYFSHQFKLIEWFVTEFFGDGVFFWVKVIVSVLNFVSKWSLFSAVFYFPDFNQEISNYFNKVFETEKHGIASIFS